MMTLLPQDSLLADLAGISLALLIGWIVLVFLSRGLAWLASTFVSGSALLVLAAADLIQLPTTSPANALDLILSTLLCLAVFLISLIAFLRCIHLPAQGVAAEILETAPSPDSIAQTTVQPGFSLSGS